MRRATGVPEEWPSRLRREPQALQNPAYRSADMFKGRLAENPPGAPPFLARRKRTSRSSPSTTSRRCPTVRSNAIAPRISRRHRRWQRYPTGSRCKAKSSMCRSSGWTRRRNKPPPHWQRQRLGRAPCAAGFFITAATDSVEKEIQREHREKYSAERPAKQLRGLSVGHKSRTLAEWFSGLVSARRKEAAHCGLFLLTVSRARAQ